MPTNYPVIDFGNNNKIYFTASPVVSEINEKQLNVIFHGKDNHLFIPTPDMFQHSKIIFHGDKGYAYIQATKHKKISLNLGIHRQSLFYMGENCSFNGVLNAIFSESRHLIIGNDVMFSFGIWIRTCDVHLIYDHTSHKRINLPQDVFIGDHVWLSQGSSLLKGAAIGSGSVVGFGALATKAYPSNRILSGSPAITGNKEITWDRTSSHSYTPEQTENSIDSLEKADAFWYSSEDNLSDYQVQSERLRQVNIADKEEHLQWFQQNPLIIAVPKRTWRDKFYSLLK